MGISFPTSILMVLFYFELCKKTVPGSQFEDFHLPEYDGYSPRKISTITSVTASVSRIIPSTIRTI